MTPTEKVQTALITQPSHPLKVPAILQRVLSFLEEKDLWKASAVNRCFLANAVKVLKLQSSELEKTICHFSDYVGWDRARGAELKASMTYKGREPQDLTEVRWIENRLHECLVQNFFTYATPEELKVSLNRTLSSAKSSLFTWNIRVVQWGIRNPTHEPLKRFSIQFNAFLEAFTGNLETLSWQQLNQKFESTASEIDAAKKDKPVYSRDLEDLEMLLKKIDSAYFLKKQGYHILTKAIQYRTSIKTYAVFFDKIIINDQKQFLAGQLLAIAELCKKGLFDTAMQFAKQSCEGSPLYIEIVGSLLYDHHFPDQALEVIQSLPEADRILVENELYEPELFTLDL